MTTVRPSIINPNAISGFVVLPRIVINGTVSTVPPTPKKMSSLRRPMRSDRAPPMGCRTMNTSRAAKLIQATVSLEMPEVLIMYFCM